MSGQQLEDGGVDSTARSPRTFAETLGRVTWKDVVSAVLVALSAYAVPLWNSGTSPGHDWDPFESFSLLTRSAVWSYHRFPLHDPWVCGGSDLLSNPQTHVASPLALLDVAFPPHWANLLSLMLYAAIGALGLQRYLRRHDVPAPLGFIVAAIFINGSWFSLHYSEGHVAFGAFQAVGWVALLFECLDEPEARWIRFLPARPASSSLTARCTSPSSPSTCSSP